jgi:hypothetical protein
MLQVRLGRFGVQLSRRYTDFVRRFWPRTISAIVVAVLAGLPAAGAICAALCASPGHADAIAGHGHHASPSPCHEALGDRPAIGGTAEHDCGWHDGDPGESPVFLSSARADAALISITGHLAPATLRPIGLTPLHGHSGSSPPPLRSATIRAPLVLRI